MTENDKLLIAEARRIYKTGHWSSVSALEDKAETKTARKIIHSIAVRMYHDEEAACGII
mgnify:FL=1